MLTEHGGGEATACLYSVGIGQLCTVESLMKRNRLGIRSAQTGCQTASAIWPGVSIFYKHYKWHGSGGLKAVRSSCLRNFFNGKLIFVPHCAHGHRPVADCDGSIQFCLYSDFLSAPVNAQKLGSNRVVHVCQAKRILSEQVVNCKQRTEEQIQLMLSELS